MQALNAPGEMEWNSGLYFQVDIGALPRAVPPRSPNSESIGLGRNV